MGFLCVSDEGELHCKVCLRWCPDRSDPQMIDGTNYKTAYASGMKEEVRLFERVDLYHH
jgi:Pyruvate/2-oxoacid:ferredoxin oxidoreductase delta subunit